MISQNEWWMKKVTTTALTFRSVHILFVVVWSSLSCGPEDAAWSERRRCRWQPVGLSSSGRLCAPVACSCRRPETTCRQRLDLFHIEYRFRPGNGHVGWCGLLVALLPRLWCSRVFFKMLWDWPTETVLGRMGWYIADHLSIQEFARTIGVQQLINWGKMQNVPHREPS